jgi:hypothetical protein
MIQIINRAISYWVNNLSIGKVTSSNTLSLILLVDSVQLSFTHYEVEKLIIALVVYLIPPSDFGLPGSHSSES